jgi:hypothetical protein
MSVAKLGRTELIGWVANNDFEGRIPQTRILSVKAADYQHHHMYSTSLVYFPSLCL